MLTVAAHVSVWVVGEDGGGDVRLRFQDETGRLCLGRNWGDAGGACGTLWQRFVS